MVARRRVTGKRRTDGMGGGSVGPTPEPSWNPWTPPTPTPTPQGNNWGYKPIGKLRVPGKVRPSPLKVGGRIFDPVADGGRREPKTRVTKRGR